MERNTKSSTHYENFIIMMGKTTIDKYIYLGNIIMEIHINSIEIPNTLINFGAVTNVMKKMIWMNYN